MRDELRALARLSEIDASAMDLDRELAEIPTRIDELRGNVAKLTQLLDMERRQLDEADALKRSHEQQVSEATDSLARARAKSAKARNAREAEMAEREVEAVRRTIKDREDERERLMTALAKVGASIEDHERELEELRQIFEKEEAAAKVRMEELQGERNKVVVGREAITAKVGKALLGRYDRVRLKRGSGVAEVVDATCTACRILLTPQQFIAIQRGETVEQCPSCLRLLYYKPTIED